MRAAYDELSGGPLLDRPGDVQSADRATRNFLGKHAQRFGLTGQPAAVSPETIVRESRGLANQRLTYQQYYRGLPVVDGTFAAFFDADGAFRGLSGAPWPDRALPRQVRPRIDEQAAVAAAIGHVQKGIERDALRGPLDADAELMVSGGLRRLVWKVLVLHSRGLGVERELLVAADNGEILSDHNLIAFGAEPNFGTIHAAPGRRQRRHADRRRKSANGPDKYQCEPGALRLRLPRSPATAWFRSRTHVERALVWRNHNGSIIRGDDDARAVRRPESAVLVSPGAGNLHQRRLDLALQ